GYDISFWVGVFVPTGTPPAVIKTLYDAIDSAKNAPAAKALLAKQGHIAMLAPEAFQARIDKEKSEYAAILKRSNIRLTDSRGFAGRWTKSHKAVRTELVALPACERAASTRSACTVLSIDRESV